MVYLLLAASVTLARTFVLEGQEHRFSGDGAMKYGELVWLPGANYLLGFSSDPQQRPVIFPSRTCLGFQYCESVFPQPSALTGEVHDIEFISLALFRQTLCNGCTKAAVT